MSNMIEIENLSKDFGEGKVLGEDMDIPKDLGLTIETSGFISEYSGLKNFKIIASINKVVKKDELKQFMKDLGLNPDSRKHVGKYSLGMRQKLGIIQAIMENPKVLILDELMNGLDDRSVELVRDILKTRASQGTTNILASHNKEDISVLCDKVYLMKEGKMSSSD